eukprot:scaffold99899_cov27-Tisochrysis_lutea.AAC.1
MPAESLDEAGAELEEGPAAEHYVVLDDQSDPGEHGDNGESEDGESEGEQIEEDSGSSGRAAHGTGQWGEVLSAGGREEEDASASSIAVKNDDADATAWVNFSSAESPDEMAGSAAYPSRPVAKDEEFGDFVGGTACRGLGVRRGDSHDTGAVDVESAHFADFTAAFGESANPLPLSEPAASPNRLLSSAPLAASDIQLIKSTMAELTITPPPWIRKMEQLQAVQRAQAALRTQWKTNNGGGPDSPSAVDVNRHWEVQVAARAKQLLPDAGSVLTDATIANASPFLHADQPDTAANIQALEPRITDSSASGLIQRALPHVLSPFGTVPVARKKVSGRQLAAERRKEREERKRMQAEVAAAAGAAGIATQSDSN